MNKLVLILFFAFLSLNSYEQIASEKGYFINNNYEKTECLIKNEDWKNNPSDFNFMISDTSEVQSASIQSVKEFGIYNLFKYIRVAVKMDRSGEDLSNLSEDRNPEFHDEVHFLKVLVEGQASLFQYEEKNLIRFFYCTNNSEITQLVYKLYSPDERKILYNNHFRQQLLTDLKCHSISMDEFGAINYYENELLRIFIKYNECQNVSYINYKEKRKSDLFNLNIRPGMNISNFSMENELSDAEDTDFGTRFTVRAGLELEYIFPFNRNKWSIMIEPVFQYYKCLNEAEGINIQDVEVDYKSFEFPLGIRYYFYLNDNSIFLINAGYALDFCFNSTIRYELGWEYEISSIGSLLVGAGYKFNRFSIEMRYLSGRNLLTGYSLWDSDYRTFSMILGYSVF